MPLIFKRTPGSTLGYEWTEPDQGIEVDDPDFANQLLHMDADFYEKVAADGESEEPEVEQPPTTGPGSGAKAWRAFAASKGVEVPGNASRDQIIEALEAAAVLTKDEGDQIEEAGEGEDEGSDQE